MYKWTHISSQFQHHHKYSQAPLSVLFFIGPSASLMCAHWYERQSDVVGEPFTLAIKN